jgi:hypothetical protein
LRKEFDELLNAIAKPETDKGLTREEIKALKDAGDPNVGNGT